MNTISSAERLAFLLDKIRKVKLSDRVEISQNFKPETTTALDKYGNLITYNEKQQAFIDLVLSGKSCILIGAAGTGKTTCMRGAMAALIQSGKIPIIHNDGHKHLKSDTPGIVITAYTRRAVANIRNNVNEDLKDNCITCHKFLEYQPVYYDVYDEKLGGTKSKMVFEPTRTIHHPNPNTIHTVACEESSMLGVDLFKQQQSSLIQPIQWIFIGDIQQLPPVFGPAILGFKLLELPVIELTEVYRQALESPIIKLAHRILNGQIVKKEEFSEWQIPNKLTIKSWTKKISGDLALDTTALLFCGNKHIKDTPLNKQTPGLHERGFYDPEEDIILLPFNESFGTIELNKHIANYLAKSYNRETYEIVSGFNRIYLSIGDRILYDKEDAIIQKIETNPAYSGASFMAHSKTLDYWGYDPVLHPKTEEEYSDDQVDFMLASVASTKDEDRVRQCSHIITLLMRDSDQVIRISRASEVNTLLLGYALTVHKAQGSEWRKVFFIVHQSHATLVSRELLYTAVTRAREELYIICEPETFVKGIMTQRVKGNTIAEKAEYFKGKIDEGYKL